MTDINLPEEYKARMQDQLRGEYAAYIEAMREKPVRGLRVNTLKLDVDEFSRLFPFRTGPAGVVPESLELLEDVPGIGNHVLHRAGLFYMQEPSAAMPAALLGVKPGMRVLDLCAAPGGKAGQIAAYLNGEGIIIANELIPERARILASNLERLGVRNALVTSMRADLLCKAFENSLDAVLLDAPCSGEGMFRKEPKAIADWSIKHVRSCAKRQRALLDSAAIALRPGGNLVYSTCTFSNEENEDVVRGFMERTPGFELCHEQRIYPHTGRGEGQYMALMKKQSGGHKAYRTATVKPLPGGIKELYSEFISQNMLTEPQGKPYPLKSGKLMLLPSLMPDGFTRLHIIAAGVHMGDIRNNMLTPAHGLALAYPKRAFMRSYELSAQDAATYFTGGSFAHEGDGYFAACVNGYPAGLIKASGGVMKSLLPKGLRGPI